MYPLGTVIQNRRPVTANIFHDDFARGDGTVGNGWSGDAWTLVSGVPVYAPVLTDRVINPGAEGTYVSGLAPNWSHVVSSGVLAEENTIKHGGASSEHLSGAGREYIGANTSGTSIGKGYLSQIWIYLVSGYLYPRVRYPDGSGVPGVLSADISESWKLYESIFVSTLANPVPAADTTTLGNGYVDDAHLYEFDPVKRFLTRQYLLSNITVSSRVTYTPASHRLNNQFFGVGIVVCLDSPSNPLNYVIAGYNGTNMILSKVVGGVATNLISVAVPSPDGDTIEIRKNGTTFQLFHRGIQLGANQIINDAAILSSRYIGMCGIENGSATFQDFTAKPYNALPPSTRANGSFTTATYSSGKGVLSLRFDDGNARDYSFVYPLLVARNLTAGFAVVRNFISKTGLFTTLAQIKTMQASGMEIMCHSYSHLTDPIDYSDFVYQTAIAVEEMRLLGLNVDSFVQPGTWIDDYYDLLGDTGFFGTPEELVLRNYFSAWEGYIYSADRSLPILGSYRHGCAHNTGDQLTLVQLKAIIDTITTNYRGRELLFHPVNIGQPTYISEADFTEFLDYVQTKVNAGLLVVLTPTQQLFATLA